MLAMDMHFEGVVFQTHAAELARRLGHSRPPLAVLDVRPAARYAAGHIPGARSLTLEDLQRALPTDTTAATELVVVGEGPEDPVVRAAALALLRGGGRRVAELAGGMLDWRRMAQPLDTGPAALSS
ncbi:MAG: rhodanese-like domain-containing protein [Thermoanaerobaculia bacterium]